MSSIYAVFASLLFMNGLQAAEVVEIPMGQIEAIWLTPVSKKDDKREPVQKISVAPFRVLRFPVTVAEFRTFIDKNPQWSKAKAPALFADKAYLGGLSGERKNDGKTPITYVSWYAARAYCHSLNMRLPTVNEWEYMAAASESRRDANRNPEFLRRILDWYGEPQEGALRPVGSIYKNVYGLWDLHGLIWEWVEDFNSSFVTGESREDSSFNKNMFCGAGSMSSSDKENYAAFMRFAFRSGLSGRSAVWNLGFRCVESGGAK